MVLDFDISEQEVKRLDVAFEKLFDLDENRCLPGRDYNLNLQARASFGSTEDRSHRHLFEGDFDGLLQYPTYRAFIALLDNYEPNTFEAEVYDPDEVAEIVAFVGEVLKTKVMAYAFAWMRERRVVQSMDEFRRLLTRLWFRLYSRTGNGSQGSSAFEHVFVGELRGRKKVIGLHNWIAFWNLERSGAVDYHGFYLPRGRRRGAEEDPEQAHVISTKFDWQGLQKQQSTILVGVSPEFEMALYTMAFFADPDEYPFEDNGRVIKASLGGDRVLVKLYRMRTGQGKSVTSIASAFIHDIAG